MNIVFDNYCGGEVKEVKVNNKNVYKTMVQKYLSEHGDNFVTVYGKGRGYVIERGDDGEYNIYETNLSNRVSMPLMEAVEYVYNNTNRD